MSAPTIPHGSLTPTPDRRLVVLAPRYPKLGGELRPEPEHRPPHRGPLALLRLALRELRDACRDERWVP
jgi:hypothetical protein